MFHATPFDNPETRPYPRQARRLLVLLFAILLATPPPARCLEPWQDRALAELCHKHIGSCAADTPSPDRLDHIFRRVGEKLAAGGISAVPAEDIAMLALLHTRLAQNGVPPAPPTPPAQPQEGMSDVTKGEEGLRQAQERLAQLPVTDRLVITGDVASVMQAAVARGAPDLTATAGRARVNFVMRAFSGQGRGSLGDGFFFVQMRAAGGPFDNSFVGGPALFTSLNDIATDRSRFNEAGGKGNLYLGKVFYEQSLHQGEHLLTGRVGVIDLTDYFDASLFANNEARQFLNSAFVNSAAFKTGITAPGVMAAYNRKVRRDWLQGVVLRVGYAVSRTERAFTSPLWTGELELETELGGRRGYWRLGGAAGNRAGAGSVRGFHLNVDHWITSNIGVFGRYGIANSGPGSVSFGPVRQSYSAGVQVRRIGENDRVSAWSLGYSQAFGIAAADPLASERVLETYYRWQWSQNISLTPDFQLIAGSGGRRSRGTQAVFAVRVNFGF